MPQDRSGRVQKISPLSGFDLRIVQSVARRYPGPLEEAEANTIRGCQAVEFSAKATRRLFVYRFLFSFIQKQNSA